MSVSYETMSPYAQHLVDTLQLEAHPEGGWYHRDWQSPTAVAGSERPLASLIYFLLPKGDFSAWHQVDADEIWLWHGPAPVTLQLAGSGDQPDMNSLSEVTLGSGITPDSQNASTITGHFLVPAGVWQRTLPTTADALVSCVVSPGFEFRGFTLANDSPEKH